jgi:hypothetical protein
MKSSPMSEQMKRCITNCQECHAECLETALHMCIEMGGKHTEPEHFRLMMSCAQICQTAADFMSGRSQYHQQTCGICAEICEACAASCEKIGGMDHCVELCRRCAQSCREMSGARAGGLSGSTRRGEAAGAIG